MRVELRALAGSLSVLLLAALASALPPAREWLLYERPEHAATWRLLSTQLLHPNLSTAAADLGLLSLAGFWLERRARGLWATVLIAALLGTAASVAWAPPELRSFEGASGLAAAMVSAALLHAAFAQRGLVRGALIVAAFSALLKACLELNGQETLHASLPPGAQVYAPAHVVGALLGLTIVLVARTRSRERSHARAA
ncbi:MAG: hypothetical protein DHS20C15_31680 [Planctomycetota bacterium]|nr:MAG: hypothetical protein DHS20C15_31680 [Planctomycetota bacterium]